MVKGFLGVIALSILTMFGPTSPFETRSLTRGSTFFWEHDNISCAPCYRFGKMPDCKTGECLRNITPDKVHAKISKLLVHRISKKQQREL